MDLKDMILVIENDRGTETNMLMTMDDYKSFIAVDDMSELADNLLQLGRTLGEADNFAEYYRAANVTVSARFCLDDIQLGHFLQGFYNDSKKFRFDKEASSSECVAKLKEIGMTDKGWVDDFNLHYEMENRSFERGQTFHNFNDHDVLKVAGQLYRYEFDNIVMVTAQRPPEKSTLMADYDTWKKVGRYVKRGAKGCAIFPSRALNPRMRYIFDISDTGGKNVKLTWDLEGENLKDYVDFLVSEGQIEQYDNSDRESLKNILKQFTGTDVWLIIKEEFGDRMTELMQLSGSVIKEESKKRNGLQQEMDMEQLVYASVMYAVGTRCGFDLSVQEQDFSQIVNIKDEEIIYRLGSIVCDVSCSVLREFSRNLKAIESERRIGYVRRNDLQGSGRTALSADRDAGRDGGSHEAGQIWKDGDELSKGERAGKIQDADEIREAVREDVSGRGGSESAVRPVRDAVSGEAQATESVIDNGDVEDKRAGEDAGRGSGTESDSDAIPLESDDTELNRELDEINSLGVSKEAEYTQASFFFDQNGQASIGTIHTEEEPK